jgi:hypothetical protein
LTVNPGYISISLSGITATITNFGETKIPRGLMGQTPPERSGYGTLQGLGLAYGPFYLLNFNGIVDLATADKIETIYLEFDRLRQADQIPDVLVIDTTWKFKERTTRTRATAPSPFDGVTTVGGYVQYFAQFYMWFSAEPQFSKLGQNDNQISVALSFVETDNKVPA